MDPKRAAVITYGCQMNKYESERISGILVGLGYEISEDTRDADLILLNTCSIRDKAEQKVYSQLGSLKWLKRDNPDLLVGVCGCVAQQEGEHILRRMPHVDRSRIWPTEYSQASCPSSAGTRATAPAQ